MDLAAVRANDRVAVWVVSVGHAFSHLYLLAFPPLFPILAEQFTLTNAQLGLIVSAVNLSGLLQTPVGELVDRVGARRVLVAGLVITGGGTALSSLADSYLALLALGAVAGIGQPAFHPAGYALLGAATGADREGRAYSAYNFAGYVGFAVAPVTVGGVALAFGWRTALVVAGGGGLAFAALTALLVGPREEAAGESADEEPATGGSLLGRIGAATGELRRPAILALFGFFVLMVASTQALQSFVTTLATDGFSLSTAVGNTALSALAAGGATGVLLGGVLADRYSPRAIIATAFGVATLTLWVGLQGPVPRVGVWFVGVFAVAGFFVGIVNPARDKLVSRYAPAGATGKTFGFVFTGVTVGAIVGPATAGTVIDLTTPAFAFLLIGGVLLAGAALALSFGTGIFQAPTTGGEAES